jgi:hypothetical protein
MIRSAIFVAALTLLTAVDADLCAAAPVFAEDFEDGAANGWAPSGGDARLTQYAGNTSLRLSGRTAVVAAASTNGFAEVTITAAMAASSFEASEYCLVEVSSDGGRTWLEVLRIEDGQDDAVTLHRAAVHDARLDNVERLLIGARVSGDSEDDQCWLDDVRIAGEAPPILGPRNHLTREVLLSGATTGDLAPMAAFAPSDSAVAPTASFRGELRFDPTTSGFRLHRDAFNYDRDATLRLRTLPRFAFDLVQDGDTLIPLRRGPVSSDHPSWEYALEPGRVWNEPGDGSLSRAALPFALIETNANCTHNGVLTFLFDEHGAVSNAAWQIASETCAYLQFDAWGAGRATYVQGGDGAAAIAAFRQERAARMPTRPMSSLAADYPGIDMVAFASPADVHPESLTTYGLVANGVHYLGGCDTRAGPYPFCESMLVPSYSLAKSLVGGLGLMRLELLHPGAMRALIPEHVHECTRWNGVTLEHALDMTTGRYASAADQADENAMTSSRFFISTTHTEKSRIACTLFPRREAPGRRWVYHTTDTYVLGAAMADFWEDRYGAEADFFNDVLVDGVYAPLQLGPAMRATRRTLDDARQPLTGWGLTLTRDDIAKLGAYLAAPPQGAPLIAPGPLAAALQRDPSDRGLEAGGETLRYNNGFWAYNAQAVLNCTEPVWIPFLSGFGGVLVALMPNGAVYYFVSDGGDYRWAHAARAANTIAPMCARTNP